MMTVKELQAWINAHNPQAKLKVDGIGGVLTRAAFIQTFVNKNVPAITETQLQRIAEQLGDKDTRRIKAVAHVESGGSGFFNNGLPKILYERHIFFRFVGELINIAKYGLISSRIAGGYTSDIDGNGINDSWDKLSFGVCVNPDAAIQSVSIGKFQVMGMHYKALGYTSPIEMLWAASQSENAHYEMLRDYILKVARIGWAYSMIDRVADNCRSFAKYYNGKSYAKYDYHNKLAFAYRMQR